MSQRLICRKCHNGLYEYCEPDKEDWWNRRMRCTNCGFEETLHEHCVGTFPELYKEKENDA